jgi:hypothetical protein
MEVLGILGLIAGGFFWMKMHAINTALDQLHEMIKGLETRIKYLEKKGINK